MFEACFCFPTKYKYLYRSDTSINTADICSAQHSKTRKLLLSRYTVAGLLKVKQAHLVRPSLSTLNLYKSWQNMVSQTFQLPKGVLGLKLDVSGKPLKEAVQESEPPMKETNFSHLCSQSNFFLTLPKARDRGWGLECRSSSSPSSPQRYGTTPTLLLTPHQSACPSHSRA